MSLISSNKVETNRVQLEFSVDVESFSKALDKAYKKMVKQLNIPGFRKGKAPRSIVEKMFGVEVLYDEAVNFAYPDAYLAAVKEAGIEPVAPADVEIKEIGKDKGCVIVATVTVKPEVTMGKYKGLKVVQVSDEVTDEDVAEELKNVQKRNARTITVEGRGAQMGDIAVVDFEGFVDGVAFEGGKGTDVEITLGEGRFIPGFEDGIVGKNVGEEFDINVTFPGDYGEQSLANKAAVFKSALKELKEKQLPELDDEFVKDVDDEAETLEEFKVKIKERLADNKKAEAKAETEQNIYKALVDIMTAEIPKEMVERAVDQMVNEYAERLYSQGMDFDSFLKYTGMTMEAMRATFEVSALYRVQVELALEAVCKAEGLAPTAEDVEAEYKLLAPMYGVSSDKLKKAIPEEEIIEVLSRRKAFEFVKENAKFVAEKEEKPAPKKRTTKKAAAAEGEEAGEEKPAKKPATRKRTTKKAAEEATEEK